MNKSLSILDGNYPFVLKTKKVASISKNDTSSDIDSVDEIDVPAAIRDLNRIAKDFPARAGIAVISIVNKDCSRIIGVIKSESNIKNELLKKEGTSRVLWFLRIALEQQVRTFKIEKAR